MKAATLYGGLSALLAVLFFAAPGIDLAASHLFYDSALGFYLADWAPVRVIEGTVPWIVRACVRSIPSLRS